MKTIAGIGVISGDDNGTTRATSAILQRPVGVWGDSIGNVYFTEWLGNRVRKVTPAGDITTVIGSGFVGSSGIGGPALSVDLDQAHGLYGDTLGSFIYVSGGASFVWQYNLSSQFLSCIAGIPPSVVDSTSGNTVPATSARLSRPRHLFVSTQGIVYFPEKTFIRAINVTSGLITILVGNGSAAYGGDNGPATLGALSSPRGVWVSSTGLMFIADKDNNRIRQVDTAGILTTFAGTGAKTPFNGENIPALLANINTPTDLKGDTLGNLFISEDGNNCRIRMISPAGIISTFMGTGTCSSPSAITSVRVATSTAVRSVNGIWIDSLRNIYYTDYSAGYIRYVFYIPPTTTPTRAPTGAPSRIPSASPTSLLPSMPPSVPPSVIPSLSPTSFPTSIPTHFPSESPTLTPSATPSVIPTVLPSTYPTFILTTVPSKFPSSSPSTMLSTTPTNEPSLSPSVFPSDRPSGMPSASPSTSLSLFPSISAAELPSLTPSATPSAIPTSVPSSFPSVSPTILTSNKPSLSPSAIPSDSPSSCPSLIQTLFPTAAPNTCPSAGPLILPSVVPSLSIPSFSPSTKQSPSFCPSVLPRTSSPSNIVGSPSFTMTSPPTFSPSFSPYPLFFSLSYGSNSSAWKSSASFFSTYVYDQEGSSSLEVSFASEGASYVVLGSRSLTSLGTIDILSSPVSLHFPVIKISPSFNRDNVSPVGVVVGDVNGDGLNDLLVCYAVVSACSIFFGDREKGLRDVVVGVGVLGSKSSFFGYAVAGAGDLNGDGYADMIVSALTGRVCYVLYGKNSWSREMKVSDFHSGVDGYKVVADSSTTLTGLSVSGVGDMNKDGKRDIAVSVQRGGTFIVYVIWGQGMGEGGAVVGDVLLAEVGNGVKGIRIIGEQGYYTGVSISGGGDVNDDGVADLMIGSVPFISGGGTGARQRSYVIFGSASTTMEDLRLSTEDLRAKKQGTVIIGGGFLVSSVGDVNDDGIDDVMVTPVDDYVGGGKTYILLYPKKVTSPPSLIPSSTPSSFPSLRPTSVPSTLEPSNSLLSMSPSHASDMNVTMNPTKAPSRRPSRLPTERPSMKPSLSPTRSPSLQPSIAPSKWKLPSRLPSKSPSLRPTWLPTRLDGPTRFPSRTLLLLPLSEYVVRQVNMTTSTRQGGVVYGVYGVNERFELSPLSIDGSRKSGWSGRIIIVGGRGGGRRGRKVYTIYPKDANEAINRIVFEDFDQSSDIIDLSHYSQILGLADVVYSSRPLSLFLVDGQAIELTNHQKFDLSEKNFIFGVPSAASSSSSSESGSESGILSSLLGGGWRTFMQDTSVLTPMIILVVFLLSPFIISLLYKKKDHDDRSRRLLIVPDDKSQQRDANQEIIVVSQGVEISTFESQRTLPGDNSLDNDIDGCRVNEGSLSVSSESDISHYIEEVESEEEEEYDDDDLDCYDLNLESSDDFDSFSDMIEE